MKKMAVILTFSTLALATTVLTAEARRCDGFNGCRCGVTAARAHGLPLNYKGYNLKQASQWKRAFPQTTPRPGVVVYQRGLGPTGHVSTIQSVVDRCEAVVSDEKGTYHRNICRGGAVYLDPNGNAFAGFGSVTTLSAH
jgi:hypothetical protein